jgi:4-hydroxybenzoyl-CoA thioesterase
MAPFVLTLPVRFADVDHAGIVYYPRFFHFFHLAFEELFRQRLGARAYVDLLDRERVGFPAVRAEADYRHPLRFGDTMEIEVSVARLGGRSITFRYRVFRAAEAATAERAAVARVEAAVGSVVCAVTDLSRFVAIPAPEKVLALIADLVEPATVADRPA